MAQLVALMSGVVLGGVVVVVGSSLARGKIFTASIGSVDSLYPSAFIYCLNLHQFLILYNLHGVSVLRVSLSFLPTLNLKSGLRDGSKNLKGNV